LKLVVGAPSWAVGSGGEGAVVVWFLGGSRLEVSSWFVVFEVAVPPVDGKERANSCRTLKMPY
jgi:hypothetical protein